jgi:hypothetical protein
MRGGEADERVAAREAEFVGDAGAVIATVRTLTDSASAMSRLVAEGHETQNASLRRAITWPVPDALR